MATTTTNFGWDIPQSTDLVKDGATAIAALGQDIDTAFIDLKGGTTGQVLAKASNTDLDYTWATDASGIPATILDAKGDIIAATAADTASRLAVGTNGQVLTADSTTATGIKWATPATGSTFVGCGVKRTTNKSISNATYTKVDFDAENFDTNAFHDNATNNTRLTVPTGQGGYYLITWNSLFAGNTSGYRSSHVTKNNEALTGQGSNAMGGVGSYTSAGNQVVVNLAAGDYIEMQVYQSSGGALNLLCEPEFNNATILTLSRLGS
jgi:hypothetical protein